MFRFSTKIKVNLLLILVQKLKPFENLVQKTKTKLKASITTMQ